MKAIHFSFVSLVSCLMSLVSLSSFAGGVKMNQAIKLQAGWNAVYVRVGPEEPADVLFKGWLVKWVALYDPADYLTTKQFSGTTSTEGAIPPGYRVWRKGDKTVSSFRYVPANSVLLAYATETCSSVFYGTPAAPRTEWHDATAQGVVNLVGVSTYADTKVQNYFSGLNVGNAEFYRILPGGARDKPIILPTKIQSGTTVLKDGEVVLVNSTKVGDWSGVMKVSPATGLDFGTSYKMLQMEVRNDSATERTFSMTFRKVEPQSKPTDGDEEWLEEDEDAWASQNVLPSLPPLYWRDAHAVVSNANWAPIASVRKVSEKASVTNIVTLTASVDPGDAWTVQFAVDRTLCRQPTGTVYGAIAEVRDITEADEGVTPSHMVTYVPISLTVAAKQEDVAREMRNGGVWPAGLWIAVADLDTVNYIGEEATYKGVKTPDVPSGGKMRVRLPIFADVDDRGAGDMWLLQRFTYGYGVVKK